jgi:DNA-directed RNA polymerase specialized sigma subunit
MTFADALTYLGYVIGVVGLVFAYLQWGEAKGTKTALAKMETVLTDLSDQVRVLRPEKSEGVANALGYEEAKDATRFEKPGDSITFPLPRLKAPPDLRERIGDAISQLPDEEKLVMTLHYYEDLPLPEIAGILGTTESSVDQLHIRAIQRLKTLTGVGPEIEWTPP